MSNCEAASQFPTAAFQRRLAVSREARLAPNAQSPPASCRNTVVKTAALVTGGAPLRPRGGQSPEACIPSASWPPDTCVDFLAILYDLTFLTEYLRVRQDGLGREHRRSGRSPRLA